jgi:hypothetical protein
VEGGQAGAEKRLQKSFFI